jgi:hypothetical protein
MRGKEMEPEIKGETQIKTENDGFRKGYKDIESIYWWIDR